MNFQGKIKMQDEYLSAIRIRDRELHGIFFDFL